MLVISDFRTAATSAISDESAFSNASRDAFSWEISLAEIVYQPS